MTQSATVKPDDELLAEIKARDANYTPEMEAGIASPSCNDRRILLRLLSACQARVEEAERTLAMRRKLDQDTADLLLALNKDMHERNPGCTTAIDVWLAVRALGADGGVKPPEKQE